MATGGAQELENLLSAGEDTDSGFRRMMDDLPVALYTTDAEGSITYYNRAAVALSGRVPELGADRWCISWKIFLPDGTRLPHRQCPMAVALRGGQVPSGSEFMAERPDGTRVWFTPRLAVSRDAEGRVTGGISLLVDITDRKNKELRTERADLLLSAIVDSSDDAIISKDLNGVITSWNKGAERMFGYTAEEAVGRSITILIPPDRQGEEPNILARLRRGERMDHFETVRRRKDGTLLDISLTISPIRDSQGAIIGASKIARDITGSKCAEAALRSSEARFRQLADSMPQIVWTARPEGYLDYYNERWYEFTGYERDRFGDESWEPILHPADLQRTREAWHNAVASGDSFRIEYRFWDRHKRRWRWFLGRAVPIRDRDNRIVKWFGSCTDIDDQKRVEDDLRRANRDLEQFAFSASHDLQEPLRSVKIFSELLSDNYRNVLDGQALEFLNYLRGGAERMEMLIRDLLTYTRVTTCDAPPEPTDAAEALEKALAGLAGTVSETSAAITADPLPSLPVHSAHLQQLFQNLIGNAIKYRSANRPPAVRVSVERQNGQWVFAVSDNGIGIPPEY